MTEAAQAGAAIRTVSVPEDIVTPIERHCKERSSGQHLTGIHRLCRSTELSENLLSMQSSKGSASCESEGCSTCIRIQVVAVSAWAALLPHHQRTYTPAIFGRHVHARDARNAVGSPSANASPIATARSAAFGILSSSSRRHHHLPASGGPAQLTVGAVHSLLETTVITARPVHRVVGLPLT